MIRPQNWSINQTLFDWGANLPPPPDKNVRQAVIPPSKTHRSPTTRNKKEIAMRSTQGACSLLEWAPFRGWFVFKLKPFKIYRFNPFQIGES
jgi:hypothetical protein